MTVVAGVPPAGPVEARPDSLPATDHVHSKEAVAVKHVCWSIGLLCLASWAHAADANKLELAKGDHIAIIGNTLADRMQHFGHLEALVQSRFPRQELVFRNLGFSGDELTLRLRSAGFGSPDDHLTAVKADVILAFFGYNESFAGPEGLDQFKHDLEDFIKHTLGQKYNGTDAPRLVLFSPLAHEDLHDRNLPDGAANNERIELYTAAMRDVAAAHQVPFVDLYAPSRLLYERSEPPLTINGIHLNESGNWQVAQAIDAALFGDRRGLPNDVAALEKLRQAVLDKNFVWFEKYRTTDGYSIFGGRGRPEVRQRSDESRGHAARAGNSRRHGGQSRPAHLGRGPRQRPEGRRLEHAAVY